MPGKAEGQADDNQRQPRRHGQGNSDQPHDNQDRSRDHPGRLDNTEHALKVLVSYPVQIRLVGPGVCKLGRLTSGHVEILTSKLH